jgi:hypothetical protein
MPGNGSLGAASCSFWQRSTQPGCVSFYLCKQQKGSHPVKYSSSYLTILKKLSSNAFSTVNPSDHPNHQGIYHDSNVDSKAGEKPATMIDASGQICLNHKLQSPLKSPLTSVESLTKALCYILGEWQPNLYK